MALQAVKTGPARSAGDAKRWIWAVLVVAVFGTPLVAAGWLLGARSAVNQVIAQAQSQVDSGQPEAAAATLERLPARSLMPVAVRRRLAGLHFRLGQDERAHGVLKQLPHDKGIPADRELSEWAGRSQRAAALLAHVERTKDERERVRLAREAERELPDAPRVLQRVVLEQLLVMVRHPGVTEEQAFEEDYLELRTKAPSLAGEVKREVERRLGREAS